MHILDPSPSVDFIEGHASHLKDPSAVLINPTGHFSHVLDDILKYIPLGHFTINEGKQYKQRKQAGDCLSNSTNTLEGLMDTWMNK